MRLSLELPIQRVEQAQDLVTDKATADVTRAAAEAAFSAVNGFDHSPDTHWVAPPEHCQNVRYRGRLAGMR
jgi:hypothetical protein